MKMLIEKEPCYAAYEVEDKEDTYVLHYRTECGGMFTLTEPDEMLIFSQKEALEEDVFDTSQIKSRKWRYCPYCGKPIIEIPNSPWLSF